jgi:hypothetical protein
MIAGTEFIRVRNDRNCHGGGEGKCEGENMKFVISASSSQQLCPNR